MSEVFLSYSRDDRLAAEAFALELGKLGIEVWWDHDLLGGEDYRQRILDRIDTARAVIVLWSRNSVKSQFVTAEAAAANANGALLPASLDGSEPPIDFRVLHTVDLKEWVPGNRLPRALLDGLGGRLQRAVDYSEAGKEVGVIGRTAQKITYAWYADFEGIIFYLIAQTFACILQMTTFVYLVQMKFAEDGGGQGTQVFGYLFAVMVGMVMAPLVMKPILETRRMMSALTLFAAGSALGLPAYFIADFTMRKLGADMLIFVGPTALILLMMLALGDRAARK